MTTYWSCRREVDRLFGVERERPAVADVAKRAAPRADVAHDHERGGALAEAFTDVGAGRLFAHRVQVGFAQDLLDLAEALAATGAHANPLGLPQRLGGHHPDRDAGRLEAALLLGFQFGIRHFWSDVAKSRCTISMLSRTPRSARRVEARPG